MSEDQLKEVEQRGYSRGYAAGRKRRQSDISTEARQRQNQAMMDRIFLTLLPVAMQAQGWTIGEEPVNTSDQRIKLAKLWAKSALCGRPMV